MTDYEALLTGYPIYIATKEIQRRKHRKKRINKKWQKRYGMIELNSMPHGETVMMDNGTIWMTKKTFESLKLSHRKGAIRNETIPQRLSDKQSPVLHTSCDNLGF